MDDRSASPSSSALILGVADDDANVSHVIYPVTIVAQAGVTRFVASVVKIQIGVDVVLSRFYYGGLSRDEYPSLLTLNA